ncbi:class I SAM-dependent methyltransferase [Maribacter sp. 2307UL18-2]|uniref:class I SAM-dependent methyltransferase n=1 Tax=Maribacter sp. 2307UL18-2 TaxID=3386274 RepID=UPI0039BD6B57
MKQKEMLSRLIQTIEANQEKIREIKIIEDEYELTSLLFENSFQECNEMILHNIAQLIKFYLFEEKIDIKNIIARLHGIVNSSFDTQTFKREAEDKFDEKFGTRTSEVREQFFLNESISIDRYMNSIRYHPSPVKSVYSALDYLKNLGVEYNKYVFIDIGSGMGRNLLIASEYPFHRIVGIEISKHLHAIAVNNIKIYKTENQMCQNINSLCKDVKQFDIPTDKRLILYFWEPFSSKVFNDLFFKLSQVASQTGKKVVLIFLNYVFPIVNESKIFRLEKTIKTQDKTTKTDFFKVSFYSN